MRLTLPVEDDEGIFTVYLADTREVVYRGPGKYKGVWDILCAEGTQIEGQPGVFAWRGELYKQPVYDARGIATVVHAKTNELVYRGPGDSHVPGHPGMCVCVCVCVCVKVSVYTHTHTHTHTHTQATQPVPCPTSESCADMRAQSGGESWWISRALS